MHGPEQLGPYERKYKASMWTQKVTSLEHPQCEPGLDVFKNFPQFIVIHTVKGFGIVSKAELDVFLELLLFR